MHCSSKPVAAVPTVRLTSALVGDPRVRGAIASRLGVGKSGRFAAMMTSGFRFSASRRGPGPRSSGARTSIPAAFLLASRERLVTRAGRHRMLPAEDGEKLLSTCVPAALPGRDIAWSEYKALPDR